MVLIGAILLVQSEPVQESVEFDGSRPEELANREVVELRSRESIANERESIASGQDNSTAELERINRSIGASISVRVMDDATNEPVEGILLTLLSERPRTKSFGEAVSDRNGRASFFGLAENMYLVRSMRRLPYAEGLAAVWLPNGQHEDVVLRLGTGGSLTGRVVDDSGAPLEGVPVLANPGRTVAYGWNNLAPERIAMEKRDAPLSDESGRFRLDGVRCEAQGIWIVEGELRAERFEKATVSAQLQGGSGRCDAFVKDGEVVDVGDLVIARLRTWRGRVINEQGASVPHAFLGSYLRDPFFGGRLAPERWAALALAPGQPGFELEDGESFADDAGRFEVSFRRRGGGVVLQSGSGERTRASLPNLEPGEIAEDVELVLESRTRLRIALFDSADQEILGAHPDVLRQELSFQNMYGYEREVWFRLSSLATVDDPMTWDTQRAPPTSEGIYEPVFKLESSEMGELLVSVPGYRRGRLSDPGGAIDEKVRIDLEELPSVRLSIQISRDWPVERVSELERELLLVVSRFSPDANPSREDGSVPQLQLGSLRSLSVGLEPTEARMFVREPGEYWVYLQPKLSWNELDLEGLVTFGPYASDETRVDSLVLPVDLLERLIEQKAEEIEAPEKLPPPSGLLPGEEVTLQEPEEILLVDGVVRAYLENSATGAPATSARVRLQAADHATRKLYPKGEEGPGHVESDRVGPGSWQPEVKSQDFEFWNGAEFDLPPGGVVDLGTIYLVPHPRIVGRLLESDGSPVPENTILAVGSISGDAGGAAWTEADGSFDLPANAGERVHYETWSNSGGSFGSRSIGQFRCLRLSELEGDVYLDPWRDVEFVVKGLLDSESFLPIQLSLESMSCQDASHLEATVGGPPSIGPQLDGERIFRSRMGTGAYRLSSTSASLGVEETVVEVVAGDGIQRIQLKPKR